MKIKILFIHHTTSIGGATNSLLFNAISLPKDKYEIKVLFLEKEGPATTLFLKHGLNVSHLTGITNYQHANNAVIKWFSRKPFKPISQFIAMLKSVPKIKAYLNQQNFDILHINTSVMLSVGLAARSLGLKTVWHIREPIAAGVLGVRRYFVRRIIRKCSNKVIAISKQDANALGNLDNLEVIYNYVNFDIFNRGKYAFNLHDELKIAHEVNIIVMLGGIVHSKGANILIKASIPILEKHKNVVFAIVGYPPNKFLKNNGFKKNISIECLEIINKYQLEDKIKFLGLRNDIPEIIASSHILVWPATVAHFSRPIIEAQSMGIPTIGTDFYSTREIIEDNVSGLLFKNKNVGDLAEKINKLITDEKLYQEISQNGYNQAFEKFNSKNNILALEKVYLEI
jgi:glycosyltransferase involved in cell wall biosynthesis